MDDRPGEMPPVLVYSSWRPPPRSTTKFAAIGVLLGIAFTPIAAFLAVASAGAGHGTYGFARLLFPYSMALTLVTGSITTPLIALAVAQWPVLGGLTGALVARRRRRLLWLLAALHAAMFLVASSNANFS